jgi:transposase-like protein
MISFKGRYFEKEIILIAIRWRVAYSLALAA